MKNRESGQMLINLYVTTKCNLRCSYCYVDKSEQRDMDDCYIVYISQFIKKMIQTNNDNRVMINFFGGEPLLRRKLIENIITKVEDEITVDKKYIITTNGTLLTKDNVDFLKSTILVFLLVLMDRLIYITRRESFVVAKDLGK